MALAKKSASASGATVAYRFRFIAGNQTMNRLAAELSEDL
jgi:hypothetical protein